MTNAETIPANGGIHLLERHLPVNWKQFSFLNFFLNFLSLQNFDLERDLPLRMI